jgi:hypothetical protein
MNVVTFNALITTKMTAEEKTISNAIKIRKSKTGKK